MESRASSRVVPLALPSLRGSLRGLSVGLAGGMMESRASRRVVPLAFPSFRSTAQPLYQSIFLLVCNMLSPCHPEMGTNGTAAGLYPTFLMKPETSFLISSNLAELYGGNQEGSLWLHQEGWIQPSCCSIRPHLRVAWRQHVADKQEYGLVQGLGCRAQGRKGQRYYPPRGS